MNASAAAAATEFCEWLQVGVDVLHFHQKDNAKPHSTSKLSTCDVVVAQRYCIFHLCQQIRSPVPNPKVRQASYPCLSVLESNTGFHLPF